MSIVFISIGLFLCICLSAVFSASEMAFSSCNSMRLESALKEGEKSAGTALKVTSRFDDALSAILIGNNLVNIAASSLGSVLIFTLTGTNSLTWVATVVITVLVIIFGETIPKISAKKNANRYAQGIAWFIRALMIILKPLIFVVVGLVNKLTGRMKSDDEETEDESVEELQSIIETAEDEGVLDSERTELVSAAIDFSDISASEVMTARVDMDAIDIDDSFEEICSFLENTPYSRIPVYRDSVDNIIGVLLLNHFYKAMVENDGHVNIESLLMEPCFVYKTTKLPSVLNQLKSAKQHLAIVTDEYSGTLGVLSMEDVLEQIVGDIWDETDVVEEEVVVRNEDEFEADGDLSIGDFIELIGENEETFDYESETAGGWAIEMLDHFPEVGEGFTYKEFEIRVLEMDGRRVEKLLVKKAVATAGEGTEKPEVSNHPEEIMS